jgi:hypothetical protein
MRSAHPSTVVFPLFALLALFFSLLACGVPASTSHAIRGPDGKRWFSITCRDLQADCEAEAAMRCPKGYRVAASPSSPASTEGGTMLVRCKMFAVEGSFRECLGDASCDAGEKCVFPKDEGPFGTGAGRCQAGGAK